MNSQPLLSADTTSTEPLSASNIINLLHEGKTLSEIAVQTGHSRHEISKFLRRYQINYSLNEERQQTKYQKTFSKCYALAIKLNRLPRIHETMHISGISVFRDQINKNLSDFGFNSSGRNYLPHVLTGYPAPEKNIVLQIPFYLADTADKKDMIQLLGQISKDLGNNLSVGEITAKISQSNVTPCFSLPAFFSQEKMKSYNYYRVQKKKKKEKLLLRLLSISNQLGYSPGKGELCKIDKSFYQRLYRAFGGLHNALKAAGLDKKSVSQKNNLQRSKNDFIEKLKQHIQQSGKIPAPGELWNLFGINIRTIEKLFSSYVSAIKKAGFTPPLEMVFKKCQSTQMLITRLHLAISLLKRPLKHHEYQIYCGSSFASYMRRFGSLKEAHRLAAESNSTETARVTTQSDSVSTATFSDPFRK